MQTTRVNQINLNMNLYLSVQHSLNSNSQNNTNNNNVQLKKIIMIANVLEIIIISFVNYWKLRYKYLIYRITYYSRAYKLQSTNENETCLQNNVFRAIVDDV